MSDQEDLVPQTYDLDDIPQDEQTPNEGDDFEAAPEKTAYDSETEWGI